MEWKKALRHPRREFGRQASEPPLPDDAARDWPPAGPAQAESLHDAGASPETARYDPGRDDLKRTEEAEVALLAVRAAAREKEERDDSIRVGWMGGAARDAYYRMRWEAINQPRITWMTPEQRDQEYERFRFTEWERSNAERIALKSPEQRREMFRSEDMLNRYRAGLPARNDKEREAYQIWRELDLDAAEDYRHGVLMPQHDHGRDEDPPGWEPADDRAERLQDDTTERAVASKSIRPVSQDQAEEAGYGESADAAGVADNRAQDAADADSEYRATRWMVGAGSGLEDGPMTRRPPGNEAVDAEPPGLLTQADLRPPGPVQPGNRQRPSGPVPW